MTGCCSDRTTSWVPTGTTWSASGCAPGAGSSGLTQKEVVARLRRLGVVTTNKALSSLEHGAGLDVCKLPELARALECTLTYLVGLTDDPGRWEPDGAVWPGRPRSDAAPRDDPRTRPAACPVRPAVPSAGGPAIRVHSIRRDRRDPTARWCDVPDVTAPAVEHLHPAHLEVTLEIRQRGHDHRADRGQEGQLNSFFTSPPPPQRSRSAARLELAADHVDDHRGGRVDRRRTASESPIPSSSVSGCTPTTRMRADLPAQGRQQLHHTAG